MKLLKILELIKVELQLYWVHLAQEQEMPKLKYMKIKMLIIW